MDASGEIIYLKSVCPWKDHLYELEAEMGLEKPIKFCVYEVCTNRLINPSRIAVHKETTLCRTRERRSGECRQCRLAPAALRTGSLCKLRGEASEMTSSRRCAIVSLIPCVLLG